MKLESVFFVVLILQTSAASAQLTAVTFGDSLTHNDLLGIFQSNPQDLYGDDPMQAVYKKAATLSDRLDSYAVAASLTGQVDGQIDLYESNRSLGPQPQAGVIGYEIGGNDIRRNMSLLTQHGIDENMTADTVVTEIMLNNMNQLSRLASSHPNGRAVLWTIPDVTLTPEWYGLLTPQQIANVEGHTIRANEYINSLASLPNVVVFDLFSFLREVVANPPVIMGQALVGPPAKGAYNNIFADPVHPTAVANAMIEAINVKWGLGIPLYSEQELGDIARIPY